jgi:transposase
MDKKQEEKLEVEIREHSDADFYPEKCPSCGCKEINRKTYKMRTIQDLGTPTICRRIRYEKVTFICTTCEKTFTIDHPLIPPRTSYMPGVIKYATLRILKEGDSIRRVTRDLNKLHNVEVSVSEVKLWVDKEGKRGELKVNFSDEEPPEDFSGFISIDGTFKAATTKKNDLKPRKKKEKGK